MPKQKPGRSKQDYGTPREFLNAVEAEYGFLEIDLAAREDNKKAPICITPEQDSLTVPWVDTYGPDRVFWLNPPFGKIGPWAAKCALERTRLRGGVIAFLVPAAVGSNWFAKYVHEHSRVRIFRPRLVFEGTPINPKTGKPDAYIKDCMLCVYGEKPCFELWQWKGK